MAPVIYAFGEHELDLRRFELRRDGIGRPVEPQAFDVLVHLMGERDRVVTKEELLDEVWGDTRAAQLQRWEVCQHPAPPPGSLLARSSGQS